MPTVSAVISEAIRPLAREDLGAVVAIDASIKGRSRRSYFGRRLQAAIAAPTLHAQFAAIDASGLAGYILARVLEGEFGHSEPALRIEVVGVRAGARGKGIGENLHETLAGWARRHGVYELRTQAVWKDHAMLRWLDAMGYHIAPNHIVDCPVEGGAYMPQRDDALGDPSRGPAHELVFDGASGNDFERLARDLSDVRAMQPQDIPAISRIDRHITGRDRTRYVKRKLAETMSDSAIRVSLTARVDDAVVGYLMARVDLGDFGRTDPTAVLDTIGVDPAYEHRGVGHAMLSQLIVNLGALRIDRIETVVAPRDLRLLGFLYDVGFTPSQRIAFSRHV